MQVILGGREECDVVFAGAGFADFWGNSARGAFIPLNDLIAQYAQDTYDAIPESLWDGVRHNGEIYGVINYQIEAKEGGVYAPTAILDKYDFDLSSVKTMEDVEPLLAKIHADDPTIIPVVVNEVDFLPLMGYDDIGTYGTPGAVAIGDDSLTVISPFASGL
jgi:putative aldouronate transport system substrate-binding protein